MLRSLPVLVRAALYAFRGGFLLRPLTIALALGGIGAILSSLEERFPPISAAVPSVLFPSHADPQIAQAVLSDIATSIMTVVSIVFAILLMTLTLASTQFSPRILIGFVRDRVTQWTLGVFLGTFCYCIAALPAARSQPVAFVPVATVTGAMLLAPVCVGWLIYFIHHISIAISVNHIVDRLRRETELVIDEIMPEPRRGIFTSVPDTSFGEPLDLRIASRQSGYIRFIDIAQLLALARNWRICVRVERRVGHFVPHGVAVLSVSHAERVTEVCVAQLLATIDIGPVRTLQQDMEFGIVQIVDIGLKAISPAVNDPTTAISCVDQLTSILIRWLARSGPKQSFYDPPYVLRLVVPWIGFDGLFDLAFEQIRHYAVGDAAVSLRLIRALCDTASTVDEPLIHDALLRRGARVVTGCTGHLQDDDLERLHARFATLQAITGGVAAGTDAVYS